METIVGLIGEPNASKLVIARIEKEFGNDKQRARKLNNWKDAVEWIEDASLRPVCYIMHL